MTEEEKQERQKTIIDRYALLTNNPEILNGLPHIKGTQIATSVILRVATDYLLEQYPKLNKEQIFQALKFAAIYEQSEIKD
jgi:uncharacterized protein (DUF433 family)